MTVSHGTKGTQGKSGRRSEALAASTSHKVGCARAVRDLNVPRDVRQAVGNQSAIEILEACSCSKSFTRQLYVMEQLQFCASRMRAAAAEWLTKSCAVAAEGGGMCDRGSGDVRRCLRA